MYRREESARNMSETIPEFGIKRENEERRDGGCAFVFDPTTQKYAVGEHHDGGLLRLFSGGVDEGEDMEAGVLREVTEESGLCDFKHIEKVAEALAHYHNTLRNVNRVAHAHCYLIILNSSNVKPIALEDHEKFSLAWATAEELLENWNARNQDEGLSHWIYVLKKAVPRIVELGYKTHPI